MTKPPFTHLHVHTQYSLLDGAARLGDMFNACNEMGMSHIAMTDHGNLHGAYDFFHQAKKAGVTPIIGIEAYVAPGVPAQQAEDPVGSAAPEAGRRVRFRWLHAQDDLGGERDGSAQPLPALLGRVRRGLADEVAADGQGDHRQVVGGAHRLHRLPLRRAPDPAAARPVRRGAQGRLRVPGHLRQGQVLPGADGPRHRDRAPRPRRSAGDRQEAGHPAAGHQRLALHVRERGRRRTTRCCASRPARTSPTPTASASTAPATT